MHLNESLPGPEPVNLVPVGLCGWTYALQDAGATATGVTVTITGVAGKSIRLGAFFLNNTGSAPTGSVLATIADGATIIFQGYVTATNQSGGATLITPLSGGLKCSTGNNCVITVPAGAANSRWVANYASQIW